MVPKISLESAASKYSILHTVYLININENNIFVMIYIILV